MCDRVSYCFQEVFQKGTSCCKLFTTFGWILFGAVCIGAAYLLLVGIGSLNLLIGGALLCKTNNDNFPIYCKAYNDFPNNVWTSAAFHGFLTVACAFVVGALIFVFGLIGDMVCKKPCSEMVTIWKKSANPNYDNVNDNNIIDDTKIVELEHQDTDTNV